MFLCQGLEVKESRWGLGTFLTQDVKAGDLIAGALYVPALLSPLTPRPDPEYTGELIYEPTTESREWVLLLSVLNLKPQTHILHRDLVKHRGRNYVFGLNTTVSIDSSYAGNETRFINHVPKPKANSCPQVWLVNGEHRIGIFASESILWFHPLTMSVLAHSRL
jgi:histone-lysine N-methyltransferase EZH2